MKTSTRWIVGLSIPVFILLVLGVAVWKLKQQERIRSDNLDAMVVYYAIRDAGTLNQMLGGTSEVGALQVMSGPLQGGMAVFLNDSVAFWMKGDAIFVVNDAAQKLLPDAQRAPAGITITAVRAVAK